MPGSTGKIFLQLLLHVLPPTSNIVTEQHFAIFCKLKEFVEKSRNQLNMLQQTASTCNNEILLRERSKLVVIRATMPLNLQHNNVALQVEEKYFTYYWSVLMNI